MESEYRQLRHSFITHLDSRRLFPGRPALRRWCDEMNFKGFANKFHGPMRQGKPVPRRMIELLVLCCVRQRTAQAAAVQSGALLDYCRSHGFESVDPRYLDRLVQVVSAPAADRSERPLDNAAAFVTTLAQRAVQAHGAFREATESELARSVEWLAVEYGRQLARRPLSYKEAFTSGFKKRGTTPLDYLERIRGWRSVAQLVAGIAIEDGDPIGATVALPLREDAYRRVRSGILNTRDLEPEDLSPTSRFVFLEAVVMKPHRSRTYHRQPNETLAASYFVQLALLTHVSNMAKDPPIHLLSAQFSHLSRERLKGLGCSIIGARHAGTDHELMERVVDISRANTGDAALWGNWRSLQRQLTQLRGESAIETSKRVRRGTPRQHASGGRPMSSHTSHRRP